MVRLVDDYIDEGACLSNEDSACLGVGVLVLESISFRRFDVCWILAVKHLPLFEDVLAHCLYLQALDLYLLVHLRLPHRDVLAAHIQVASLWIER
mmetsp:Transcript_11469/g.17268  ORF Transcript_11469/g.17268 Transcript_11469/m.17268 type:complete len:95 (-) Transcript_11469:1263-1547(-)